MHRFLRLRLHNGSVRDCRIPRHHFGTAARLCSTIKNNRSLEYVLKDRRQEAARSIVVQVNSEKSYSELFNYCQQFGAVKGCHHYKLLHDELHYILVEFKAEESASAVANASCFNDDLFGAPVRSPFVWFRACKTKSKASQTTDSSTALEVTDGTRSISNDELQELLLGAENLSDQITILHRTTCLNDLETRLRFLAARQVESSVAGMFPNANALPFGSTVNGFGNMGCDLDLILRFEKDQIIGSHQSESRLVFHTKQSSANGRSQMQRQMESIGDILHLFLPGVSHVRRILQARVPIIKFHHDHLGLEVDLSMSNLTGLYMSELLYMFGQIDDRVRPLTFCLRRWAQTCGLTNPSPGRWITNFSLTCLVVFFFQQLKQPIIPPINLFMKCAKSSDLRVTEDGISCSFARDLKDLPFATENTSPLNELLLQFFEHFSQFDFNNRAISLNEGRSIVKPDHSAMYIVNPLEQHLNVCKNLSLEECERFRIEVRNAAWLLESEMERNGSVNNGSKDSQWGLLNLFRSQEKTIIRPNMFFKPRLVDVSELFDDSRSMSGEQKKEEFKNDIIRSQVKSARTQAKNNMRQMQAKLGNKSSSKTAR